MPPPELVRVLIVDDHRLFNDGLRAMLADEPRLAVVGQVYDSREALRQIHLLAPDLILLDFNMPHLDGLTLTRQLVNEFSGINILILSMYAEQRYIADFSRAGAKGYLIKTASRQEVVAAALAIARGSSYFAPLPTAGAGNNHSGDEFLKRFSLTPREVEVIRQVRQGLSSQQIADLLCVSFYTVETHRRNIHLKLGITNSQELVRFAFENGI
ncbi:MAG: response regulator transcription factor [Cytophagaceae bacterium]|nr:response regulator transcription factor [Cytophagaceae bacterium]